MINQNNLHSIGDVECIEHDPECGEDLTPPEEAKIIFIKALRNLNIKIINISNYIVGKNKYRVISRFVGDKNIKDSILNLAENKAIKTMGLK
jgi:hypothetical protein